MISAVDQIKRWWCKYYNRPKKDPLLEEYTPEELAIEYFEHKIEADPTEAFPRIEHGEDVQFITDDPVFNSIEQALAKGDDIDILASFPADDRAKVRQFLKQERERGGLDEGFADKYGPGEQDGG